MSANWISRNFLNFAFIISFMLKTHGGFYISGCGMSTDHIGNKE
jgi:hypothetical protein